MKGSDDSTPLISDVVLIGGGHAHVHILKMFGMKPPPASPSASEVTASAVTASAVDIPQLLSQHGVQTTLITSDVYTPYSGMLPGFVAGHYPNPEDIHLDLRKLCSFSNIRFIHASAIAIRYNNHDTGTGTGTGGGWVQCSDGRPDVRFDVLSIDVGSSPSIPPQLHTKSPTNTNNNNNGSSSRQQKDYDSFANLHMTPVKPISGFAARWDMICNRVKREFLMEPIIANHDTADTADIAAAAAYVAPSKDIPSTTTRFSSERPFVLLVVGGGAGGIELALSAQYALQNIVRTSPALNPNDCIKIIIATRGSNLLDSHNTKVQQIFSRILKERNVELRTNAEAVGIEPYEQDGSIGGDGMEQMKLCLSSKSKQQSPIIFDECLWCTSAGGASWLSNNTPFDTTHDGFLKVKDTYELVNHPGVFAVGDCCHMVNNPRPKAGVFAVRAGPYVKDNIISHLLNRELQSHKPQTEFLGLVSTGNKYAVASRGDYALEGEFLWVLKDEIDQTWMDGYKNLPQMEDADGDHDDEVGGDVKNNDESRKEKFIPPILASRGPDAMAAFAAAPMRCGGCGAKVGATTLSRVLDKVHQRRVMKATERSDSNTADDTNSNNVPTLAPRNIDHEDAAVVMLPKNGGGAMVYTIDFFRSFLSDPFLFGKIAAIHALSDCHAMGASAQTALALAIVPFSAFEAMTESALVDMLSGASDVLDEDGCELAGGHTCEGTELGLGFSINGYIENPHLLLKKRGGTVGDKLVLTKPIGTGAVFAADMRAKCKGRFVEEALESMTVSNGMASQIAMEILGERVDGDDKGIHACTDVTGFGLVGHLLEMLLANDGDAECENIGAKLEINSIPFLEGALEASTNEIVSSLHRENYRSKRGIANHQEALESYPIQYPLLFDPQTAGGLLFMVSPDICDAFVDRLVSKGGTRCASVIGEITSHQKSNTIPVALHEEDATSFCSVKDTEGFRIQII